MGVGAQEEEAERRRGTHNDNGNSQWEMGYPPLLVRGEGRNWSVDRVMLDSRMYSSYNEGCSVCELSAELGERVLRTLVRRPSHVSRSRVHHSTPPQPAQCMDITHHGKLDSHFFCCPGGVFLPDSVFVAQFECV